MLFSSITICPLPRIPLHPVAAAPLLVSLALSDPAREIQPRVFYEKVPGALLYAEDAPARGPLKRLFLYRASTGPEEPEKNPPRAELVSSSDLLNV